MCEAVDFDSFQKVLNRPGGFREPGEPEEYCRGFQVFDKDMTGFIGVGQLRYSESSLSRSCVYWFGGVGYRMKCRGDLDEWLGNKGLIEACVTVLTNLGEKMSDEEVDELLKAVDTSSGEINYTGKPTLSFLPILYGFH